MLKIEFTVYGEPLALKRHRRTTIKTKLGGEFTKEYDPSSGDKISFMWKSIAAYKPKTPWQGPIRLTCKYYMKRPKSHFGTGKNAGNLKPSAPTYHTSKPDLDNLVKFVKDALNGIYYNDDSQICSLGDTQKFYTAGTPRTEITLEQL